MAQPIEAIANNDDNTEVPTLPEEDIRELADFWPEMPDLQDGRDLFAKYPIAGATE